MDKTRLLLINIAVILSISILISGGCCGGCEDDSDSGGGWGYDPPSSTNKPPEITPPPEPPDPCESYPGSTYTDAVFTQTELDSGEYSYDASFTILACKEDITYKVYLESERIVRIGSGTLSMKERISDTYSNTGTTDFAKVCIEASGKSKQCWAKS